MTEPAPKTSLYRVGVLALPGFALMSYACTVEPLRAANLLAATPLYDVVHLGTTELIPSSGAAQINTARPSRSQEAIPGDKPISEGGSLKQLRRDLDLLLVIAGGDPFSVQDPNLLTWLQRMDRAGVRIGGVSGGPVVLARAGLMAGRRMTVHWEHAALLAERFPDCLIERRLYVIDRDRVTCGGGIAPLDLMHALIASHHGSAFARLVSDWFLHTDIRAAAAPQRSEISERIGATSPQVAEAMQVMESHIGDPLSLSQLALTSGISARHLNRLFKEALGVSTMDHYRMLRLSVAQRLLRHSAMSIAEIAQAVGFSNAGHFSNAYKAQYDNRPQAERRRPLTGSQGASDDLERTDDI